MAKKVIYYSDVANDDFADNGIVANKVSSDFPFAIKNPFWRILEFIMYRLVATPLIWLIAKIGFGFKVENRKVLKSLRNTGYFLYGNHTQQMMDAYTPNLAVFPRHVHIITGPEAVSIKGIRRLVQLLGGIPLPSAVSGYKPFLDALNFRMHEKRVITVYPEAHIWPWYTGIRNFPDGSFNYPVKANVPVVALVTTYRERKIFKSLWPCITATLSEPFYPDPALSPKEQKRKLRDEVYEFMLKTASKPGNYAYYEYVKNDNKEMAENRD